MIKYKMDILKELRKAGYTDSILRQKRLLSPAVLQRIREGKIIHPESLDKICYLLNCQPGDILMWEID